MKVTLSNGIVVDAKKIKDINDYRGFYVKLANDVYVVSSFNSAGMEMGYMVGYDTNGLGVVAHLNAKLSRGEKLLEREKIDFYDKINIKTCVIWDMGVPYSFKEHMFKVPGVRLYTLDKTLEKIWLEKAHNSVNLDLLDLKELFSFM